MIKSENYVIYIYILNKENPVLKISFYLQVVINWIWLLIGVVIN